MFSAPDCGVCFCNQSTTLARPPDVSALCEFLIISKCLDRCNIASSSDNLLIAVEKIRRQGEQ